MRANRWLVVVCMLVGIAATACGDDDDKKCDQNKCLDCLTNLGEDDEINKCDGPCDKCTAD